MAKNIIEEINAFVDEKIKVENLEDIVGERFGRYSKYIIQDRALPDVRDGLKPVQRRILFSMYKLGMFSDKPYKKSARIVGDVIGKYHPHGDTSVYDAMVRLSQTWKIRIPLIDMHGNNGSIDGDSAAAMRYTEARMSQASELLLKDIDKRTVGFIPNFDDEEYELMVDCTLLKNFTSLVPLSNEFRESVAEYFLIRINHEQEYVIYCLRLNNCLRDNNIMYNS